MANEVIIKAGKALIGAARLVTNKGIEVTENVNNSVKVTLQKQKDEIVGKFLLVDSEASEVTDPSTHVLKTKLSEALPSGSNRIGSAVMEVGVSDGWKQATILANGTVSETVDLGGHYAYLLVIIPTIVSAQLELQVGREGEANFQDFGQDATTVASTGAFNDTWTLGGWQYIKIKSSAAQTSAVTFFVKGATY